MNKTQATAIAGTLGKPSKMPGLAYGLPAEECITGSKLVDVKGSTCSNCYALKGFYKLYAKTVKPHQYKHLESISHPLWIEAMVTLISKSKTEFFRWHDSGDLQSVEHLTRIVEIAKALPSVKFWLPTREYAIVKAYQQGFGRFPENLVIRISAHMIDKAAPEMGLPTSQVHSTDKPVLPTFECPARYQGNSCGDCRACWSPKVKSVSYHQH